MVTAIEQLMAATPAKQVRRWIKPKRMSKAVYWVLFLVFNIVMVVGLVMALKYRNEQLNEVREVFEQKGYIVKSN